MIFLLAGKENVKQHTVGYFRNVEKLDIFPDASYKVMILPWRLLYNAALLLFLLSFR